MSGGHQYSSGLGDVGDAYRRVVMISTVVRVGPPQCLLIPLLDRVPAQARSPHATTSPCAPTHAHDHGIRAPPIPPR